MYSTAVNSTPSLPTSYICTQVRFSGESLNRFMWLTCGLNLVVLPWMMGGSFIGAPNSLSYPCPEVWAAKSIVHLDKVCDQIWTSFFWRIGLFLQIALCILYVLLSICFGDYYLLVLISGPSSVYGEVTALLRHFMMSWQAFGSYLHVDTSNSHSK
jgi:hypothetical protein